jgi:hypothetical protein
MVTVAAVIAATVQAVADLTAIPRQAPKVPVATTLPLVLQPSTSAIINTSSTFGTESRTGQQFAQRSIAKISVVIAELAVTAERLRADEPKAKSVVALLTWLLLLLSVEHLAHGLERNGPALAKGVVTSGSNTKAAPKIESLARTSIADSTGCMVSMTLLRHLSSQPAGAAMSNPGKPIAGQGGVIISPTSAEQAPFIYFDGVSCFGQHQGTIQIELAASVPIPAASGCAQTSCKPRTSVAVRLLRSRFVML